MSAYLRVEINNDHCQQCQRLLGGILNYPTASDNQDWESQLLGQETVRCFKNHHRSFRALVESAKGSCIVCRATVVAILAKEFMTSNEQLLHFAGEDLTYQFWLPERKSYSRHCDIAFGFGGVSQYCTTIRMPGGGTRRAIEMEFYRRNGADSHWTALDTDNLFQEKTWPILAPRPNLDSGSGEAVQRSMRWLTQCLESHTACSRPLSKLPKRVLNLMIPDDPDIVRLYETRGEVEQFVALSYCWGLSGALTTVGSNIERHRSGIRVEDFPRTLREAILFTRKLGFRYLWIDALCIIQDDADDWAEQAASMIDVYGTSTITLSATSSYDCDHGLFARMSESGVPVGRYYHPGQDAGHGTIFLDPQGPEAPFDLNKEFLSTRGWAFQERLVSPRTLHFTGAGIVWECSDASFEEGITTLWGKRGLKKGFTKLIHRDTPGTSKDQRASLQKKWNDWICDFSDRKLTKISDKLPAVAGIAKAFAARFDDTYIAGLWISRFLAGLVWMRSYKALSLVRHEHSGIPSWSWASVSGQLSYSDFEPEPPKAGVDMVVHDINVVEKRPRSYGEIKAGGYIMAEGMLQLVELDRTSEMRNPNGPFYPCRIAYGMVPGIDIECYMDQMEFEDPEEPYNCWCLRVCSYDRGGSRMVAFLFLEQLPEGNNRFRRVGAGVTEVLADADSADPDWDEMFISGDWTMFQLL
jgi:hypothetical protein